MLSTIKQVFLLLTLGFLFLATGCDSDSIYNGSPGSGDDGDGDGDKGTNNGWLIDTNFMTRGAGKDDIPAIDNPQFTSANSTEFLSDDDLVIGIKIGDDIRAYPHRILNWHEIANDVIDQQDIAITYCPLTGTSLAWPRNLGGETTTFGVSGLLYKNNLVPYDRNTDSEWSQMLSESIHGELKRTEINTRDVIEIKWGLWKNMYPESKVLNRKTGFSRDYTVDPYESYKNDHNSGYIIPLENTDDRLRDKVRVHGIIAGNEKIVYPLKSFDNRPSVINDTFNGHKIVVFGSALDNIINSFNRTLHDGTVLEFEAIKNNYPVVMKDQEGNKWNIFGEAVEGPREGADLPTTESYNGFWFAWVDFFPDLKLYDGDF